MCRLFRVRGRVQGVFFRVSTRDVALPLGLSGHAINLQDGSVEQVGDEAVHDLLGAAAEGHLGVDALQGTGGVDVEATLGLAVALLGDGALGDLLGSRLGHCV